MSLRKVKVADSTRPNFRDSKHYINHHQIQLRAVLKDITAILKEKIEENKILERNGILVLKIYLIFSWGVL